MIEHILNQITDELSVCPFINGIVLGGSRATGMATDKSDIDIGIYYDKGQVDFKVERNSQPAGRYASRQFDL